MEDASRAITRHLEAVSTLTSRVKAAGSSEREARQLEERSLERENAVTRYENHLGTHQEQQMSAGASGG